MRIHPTDVEILALAIGTAGDGAAGSEHIESCATCGRRARELARLADSVILSGALEAELERPVPPTTSSSPERKARFARMAAKSDSASAKAGKLLEIARGDEAALVAKVRDLADSEQGRLTLLYAAQAAWFAAAAPQRALFLAEAIRKAVSEAGADVRRPPASVLRAESGLLASQALLNIGRLGEAREAAAAARTEFSASGADAFASGLCDYFEASAMSFQGEFGRAERLLKTAAQVFAEFGQDHWLGRAEAMLGVTLAQRGNYRRALATIRNAVERLDPDRDANSYAASLLSCGRYLGLLGRFEEARRELARALQVARNHELAALLFGVRQNLAELDLLEGDHERSLHAYRALAEEADRQGLEEDQVVTRLAAAECLGRLGRTSEMMRALRDVGRRVAVTDLAGNPAWAVLASRLDPGDVDVGLVAEVRTHLEAALEGFAVPFRQARRA